MREASSIPSRDARRGGRRAPRGLFIALTLALVAALAGVALMSVSVPLLRERRHLRRVLAPRLGPITMTSLEYNRDARRLEHLRNCYLDPAKTDPARISWNLLCRPTPFSGYAPEPGEQQEGRFNEQQLRNVEPLPLPKPADEYRIFMVGGSLAYSVGAPDSRSTIDAFLERELNDRGLWPGRRVRVWNAAVCGWAGSQERQCIETRLAGWQPDMIIALTGANDVHWGFDGFDVFNVRTYEDQMYLEMINTAMRIAGVRPYPPEPPARRHEPVPPRTVAFNFLKNIRLAAAGLAIGAAPPDEDVSTGTVPPRYIVALQPTLADKTPNAAEQEWLDTIEPHDKPAYLRECFELFAAGLREPDGASRKAGIEIAQVADVFAARNDAIFLDLFHVGDKGNQLIARRLAEQIALLNARRGMNGQ